jgi:hypothetical protein
MGEENLRTIHYLFVVKILASEAFPPDMSEFPWTAPPFVQPPAPPIERDAPLRITALLLEDMVYGDLVFKPCMGLLDTFEYILSFVVIDYSSNERGVFGQ